MSEPASGRKPDSRLCHHSAHDVYYGEHNLVDDLLGKVSFIDVFMKQTFGRFPTPAERTIVDAVLVALMEHGMTPSAIASRMVYSSSPENLQSGVAAGLLAVGSRFVGTMEPAAELLARIVNAGEAGPEEARVIARHFRERREPVPGFGHHLHKPDDPRAAALLDLANRTGVASRYCAALRFLAVEIDEAAGRHITVNATGAIAALLADIGVAPRLMRGFAVLGRCAGLISHIAEEQHQPSGRFIWDLVDKAMEPPTAP